MGTAHTIGGSGSGLNISFVTMGSDNTNNANNLVASLNTILSNGGTVTDVSPSSLPGSLHPSLGAQTPIYLTVADSTVGAQKFSISSAGYVVDTIGGTSTVVGNTSGGDTLLAVGENNQVTFDAFGGNNDVVFVTGDNLYMGALNDTAGVDTITAGTGFDTIDTGKGKSTVYAGTGNATITLNDTGAGAFNDRAFLNAGHALVNADGTNDGVIASAAGQTIVGGTGVLTVVLQAGSNGDLVTGGSGNTYAFVSANGDTVNAGSSISGFIASANVAGQFNVGNGTGVVFASSGDSITMSTQAGDSGIGYFVGGAGNETLNAATATNTIYAFLGTGSETLTGGTGTNQFVLSDSGANTSNIEFKDFLTGNTHLTLSGFSATDLSTIQNSGTEMNGNYVVSLSNGLTLTFDGVTSGSELTKITSFNTH